MIVATAAVVPTLDPVVVARINPIQPEERAQCFGAASAHKSGDTENFSRTQRKGD